MQPVSIEVRSPTQKCRTPSISLRGKSMKIYRNKSHGADGWGVNDESIQTSVCKDTRHFNRGTLQLIHLQGQSLLRRRPTSFHSPTPVHGSSSALARQQRSPPHQVSCHVARIRRPICSKATCMSWWRDSRSLFRATVREFSPAFPNKERDNTFTNETEYGSEI